MSKGFVHLDVNGLITNMKLPKLIATSVDADSILIFADFDETTDETAYRCTARIRRTDGLSFGPIALTLTQVTQDEADEFGIDYLACRKLTMSKKLMEVSGPIDITIIYETINELGKVIETAAKPQFSTNVYEAVPEVLTEDEYTAIREEMLPRDLGDVTVASEFNDVDELIIRQSGATKKITGSKLKDELVSEIINDTTIDEDIDTQLYAILNEKEVEYAPRLTNVESEIVNKANITYVDNIAQSLASGSPKGTYPTLADLNIAIPDGNTNIYITLDNGHWNYFDPISLLWVVGGLYQSSGIADKSITPNKTNFITQDAIINRFDETKPLEADKVINKDGTITSSVGISITDFIPVFKEEILIIPYDSTFVDNFVVCLFKADKTTVPTVYATIIAGENNSYRKIIIPNDDEISFARFNIKNGKPFMIISGADTLPENSIPYNYDTYYLDEKIKVNIPIILNDESITPEKTTFLHKDDIINFYKKGNQIENSIINRNNGGIESANGYQVSDYIDVSGLTSVKFTKSTGLVDNFYVCGFNSSKSFVLIPTIVDNTTYLFAELPSTVKYVKLSINNLDIDKMMLVDGNLDYPAEYIPYNADIFTLSEKIRITNQLPSEKLNAKSIGCCGDSIMESRLSGDAANGGGWPKIIGDRNNMAVTNLGKSGSTIAQYYSSGILDKTRSIYWQLTNLSNELDFIIFDGCVNDFGRAGDGTSTLGTISSGYSNDVSSYNLDTLLGSLEAICSKLIYNYHNTKYGWIFNHKIIDDNNTNAYFGSWLDMKNAMETVFNKWGIPYLDLETQIPPLNKLTSEMKVLYTGNNGDGWHPNEDGYKKFYCDKIEAWLKTL